MKLRFSVPAEFLAELEARPPNVDGVLRATREYQRSQMISCLQRVSVVATYLRAESPRDGFPGREVYVVELRSFVGEYLASPAQDEQTEKTRQRGDELLARLEAAAKEQGLEYRAGIYEPAERTAA